MTMLLNWDERGWKAQDLLLHWVRPALEAWEMEGTCEALEEEI